MPPLSAQSVGSYSVQHPPVVSRYNAGTGQARPAVAPALNARTRAFVMQFAQAYPDNVVRDHLRREAQNGHGPASSQSAPAPTPVLDSLRHLLTRAWMLAHEHTLADAAMRLGAIADAWPRLSRDEQASVTVSVDNAILHDLSFGVAHGMWTEDAIAYVTRLLHDADESWALSLRWHDTAGRLLFAAGYAYAGDSLRYRSELITEWWRDRGDREGVLAAASMVRGDTATAVAAWTRQWDAYGQGDARGAQPEVASHLLVAQAHGDAVAVARYAADAFLTMDHHDGKVSPALAMATARFDSAYRAVYKDSTTAGRTHFLDAVFHDDLERTEPIPVTPYQGPVGGRTVLLSTMTWVDCGGCRSRDQALDALLQRYPQQDVFVLVHHYEVPFVTPGAFDDGAGWTVEHGLTPPPYDPMTRDGPCALMHVNGTCPPIDILAPSILGAPPAPRLYDLMVPRIDSLVRLPALGAMHATVQATPGHVAATVRLDSVVAWPRPLKLQIVLVEDSLHFQGGNYLRIWRMVPRQFAGDSTRGFGFVVPPEHRGTFAAMFDLAHITRELQRKNEWIDRHDARPPLQNPDEIAVRAAAYVLHPTHLSVLVFVHDATTGEVLHTIMQRVPVTTGAPE